MILKGSSIPLINMLVGNLLISFFDGFLTLNVVSGLIFFDKEIEKQIFMGYIYWLIPAWNYWIIYESK